ncbi:fasciclin domain-containing protein [Brevundimonas goettingensis]|jgi:uncharacterized surface protein with fasciclin (FAS1) repeats|uniref:Fasciclin domain-containing protein n=1 Tax=Brevundimonas goettingensis TaxID=2774190 RepID=A0A975C5J2_9CAUL|nr:fasciclin domain-containing protein [Brevundimonas goettingensis]QTC91656.1 fasciclin domain-containing protein [Brevundimonas goettingensis]
MHRARLLTATAAIALFAAPAFAQDMAAPQTAPAEAPAPAVATPAASDTVIDELKANGQFTTLLAALDQAQLTDTLKAQPAISIFAPTDAAFASLPEAERARLMDPANINELRQLLLYHVIVADVNSSQIKGTRGGVETAARTQVQLDGTGDAIKVDDATVTTADIAASNGAVFAIDKVLNPATSQVASGDADEAPAAPMTTEAPAAEAPATAPVAQPTMTDPVATSAPSPTPPIAPTPDEDKSPTMTEPAPAPTPQA